MKKIIIIILGIITSYECYGQRYEVWVNPVGHNYEVKGFYGFSNDSVLTVYSKSTLFTPSRDSNIKWDRINSLNIRNASKNEIGAIIGTTAGTLISYLLLEEEKKGNIYLASEFGGGLIISTGLIGGGALIGYLATCAKISIPLTGKSSKEKNQALKDRIIRKRNN
jgi:hypothetical protein